MDEWHVGDPSDWGDSVGVPDIPYMGYINDDEEDAPEEVIFEKSMSDRAWDLRNQGNYEAALDLINRAMEINPPRLNDLNRKAIILQDLFRFEEAVEFYDKALALGRDDVVLANKARCLLEWVETQKSKGKITSKELDIINEALRILPDTENNYSYLQLKGEILERLGEPVKAKICYLLSNRMFDLVRLAEDRLKRMRDTSKTFIAVAGTQFYAGSAPFHWGVTMNLVREPDNKYDDDAIRVEIDGECVGYVANSKSTLIPEVKSASDIKDMDFERAIFEFVLLGSYYIARII